jgi:intracellular sulfur oxidation DsrE/DsrF family protein
MSKRWSSLIVAVLVTANCGVANAQQLAPRLSANVPTKLANARVVVDVGNLVLNGNVPFSLADINLLASDLQQWGSDRRVIAIFHGDAAYLVLNDSSYNAYRHVDTGNPNKNLLNGLMKNGVQLELCGATAKANGWGNADLLDGVKVNVNAMVRLTQLERDGYTMIYE